MKARYQHYEGETTAAWPFISTVWVFIVFQLGLSVVGQRQHNQQQLQHAQPTVTYLEYLASADYLEATMENWESEFLQMFAYVLLTAFLFQKGCLQPASASSDGREYFRTDS